jgi:hypothetical protein
VVCTTITWHRGARHLCSIGTGSGLTPLPVESAWCRSGTCRLWTQAMGPCKYNFTKIAKRAFSAVVILASPLGYAAAPVGKPGQSGTSGFARLNIGVVVMPVLQTPRGLTPSATTHDAISYNFEARRREHRYELRTLPADRTSDFDMVHARVLQIITIVPQ